MIRIEFQKELEGLHQEIIRMGALVEAAINEAVMALMDQDCARAQRVIDGDDVIDAMEREIDRRCIEIIARQQPVASDLRDITSTLKLITDLERIADHASDISERVIVMCRQEERIPVPYDISRMAEFSKNMLREALDSYVTRNEQQAAKTIEMDEQVDEMYERIKTYLTRLMKVDASSVDQLVELLLVSKYFERISDHAQNVAEWVLYFIKGRHMSHQHERNRQDE